MYCFLPAEPVKRHTISKLHLQASETSVSFIRLFLFNCFSMAVKALFYFFSVILNDFRVLEAFSCSSSLIFLSSPAGFCFGVDFLSTDFFLNFCFSGISLVLLLEFTKVDLRTFSRNVCPTNIKTGHLRLPPFTLRRG